MSDSGLSRGPLKRIAAIFYRTEAGTEPVRAWLKDCPGKTGAWLERIFGPSNSAGPWECQPAVHSETECSR